MWYSPSHLAAVAIALPASVFARDVLWLSMSALYVGRQSPERRATDAASVLAAIREHELS